MRKDLFFCIASADSDALRIPRKSTATDESSITGTLTEEIFFAPSRSNALFDARLATEAGSMSLNFLLVAKSQPIWLSRPSLARVLTWAVR